jgi:hypothetical protein
MGMRFTRESPKEIGWYWLKPDPEIYPGLPEGVYTPLMVSVYQAGDTFWFEDTVNHEEYQCPEHGRLWAGPITPEMPPIDMLLFCPNCGEQHIDEAKSDVCETCGRSEAECVCSSFTAWLNPPHKSHYCGSCYHVWRPADVPTNGVAAIQTKGRRDGDQRPKADAALVSELTTALEDIGDWLAYGLAMPDGAEPTAEDIRRCQEVAENARKAADRGRSVLAEIAKTKGEKR